MFINVVQALSEVLRTVYITVHMVGLIEMTMVHAMHGFTSRCVVWTGLRFIHFRAKSLMCPLQLLFAYFDTVNGSILSRYRIDTVSALETVRGCLTNHPDEWQPINRKSWKRPCWTAGQVRSEHVTRMHDVTPTRALSNAGN